jgi:nucleoid DNA-binding protein
METVRLPYLVNEVAEELNVSKSEVRLVLDVFFEIIQEELAEGNTVHITPYVKFKHRISPAIKKGTMVRNPFNGTSSPSPGRPAKIGVTATVLSGLKKSAPSSTSPVGKSILAEIKAKKEKVA